MIPPANSQPDLHDPFRKHLREWEMAVSDEEASGMDGERWIFLLAACLYLL